MGSSIAASDTVALVHHHRISITKENCSMEDLDMLFMLITTSYFELVQELWRLMLESSTLGC